MDGQDPNNNNIAPSDDQQNSNNNEFINLGAEGAQDMGGDQPGMGAGGVVGGGAEEDENQEYFDDGGETFLPADHVCNRFIFC